MIEDISNRLLGEFARSLQGMLAGTGDDAPVVETKAEPTGQASHRLSPRLSATAPAAASPPPRRRRPNRCRAT